VTVKPNTDSTIRNLLEHTESVLGIYTANFALLTELGACMRNEIRPRSPNIDMEAVVLSWSGWGENVQLSGERRGHQGSSTAHEKVPSTLDRFGHPAS
jgi:hypothetical protein